MSPCNLGCLIERSFACSQLPEIVRYSSRLDAPRGWRGRPRIRMIANRSSRAQRRTENTIARAGPIRPPGRDELRRRACTRRSFETLRARGHEVDDCDLNAEGFDPVMTGRTGSTITTSPEIDAASVLMSTACSNPTRWSFPFRSGTWAFPRSSRASSTKCSCRASASI